MKEKIKNGIKFQIVYDPDKDICDKCWSEVGIIELDI